MFSFFYPTVLLSNGKTTEETIFEYKQNGKILTSEYSGGKIQKGHSIGHVAPCYFKGRPIWFDEILTEVLPLRLLQVVARAFYLRD